MSRPLIQNGIGDLERLFQSSQGNAKTLESLEYELRFRSVPRATALLAKVRRAMNGAPVVPAPSQDVLFDHKPAMPVQTLLPTINTTPVPALIPAIEALPLPQLSIEDACKFLKVSATASWDTIEKSRREIVGLTRPDLMAKLSEEQRQALRHDAMIANAAHNALFQARKAR